MTEVKVEIAGPQPPCSCSLRARKVVEKAAEKLADEGYNVKVTKIKVDGGETVSKYGTLAPPAIVVNGTVKVTGESPSVEDIEKLIRQAA